MGSMRSTQGMLCTAILAGMSLFAVSGWGQTMNAQISGGGGSGKCTFEVRVDGVADVQIRGNQGFLQTKSGMRAQWVRLQCNQPLPRNPNNFRFQGVDGRGRQNMLRNPSNNNGVAVIRIEDTGGGMEGYTGDIFWNGSNNNNGGNWNGGWWQDDWNGGGGWGNGGGNGGNGQWPPPGGGGNGQWNKSLVPNCQNAIRGKLVPQFGGSISFKGTPSRRQAGSFIMVDGNATYRDRYNRQGNLTYHCTMHPNGNVADSSYNLTSGNFNPQAPPPQPR